jgi:3-hydroxyacyl-CoA dehydrogenase/enoyl-CoA hydratase/3-hydroxybutyryl-CoA epimerase
MAGVNPFAVFEGLVTKGWLGQKTGAGFYLHQGKKEKVNESAAQFIVSEMASMPKDLITDLPPSAASAEARERMVLLMVNEAAMVFDERVADDSEAIDLAMVMGTGWAPHRGGPIHYARQRGIDNCKKALAERAERLGLRFTPSPALDKLASVAG